MNDLIGQVVTIKGELYGGKIQSIVGIEVSPNSSLEGKCCIAHGILSLRQHKKGTSRAYDVVPGIRYRFGKLAPQTAYTLTTVLDTFSLSAWSIYGSLFNEAPKNREH